MRVLVSGATGLVGVHVVLELLSAGHEVLALVRSGGRRSARRRLLHLLSACPGFPVLNHNAALTVVPGDLQVDRCGFQPAELDGWRGRIDAVVHCAASVAFEDQTDVMQAVNVDGVSQVLALTTELEAKHYIHLSTAYVDRALRGEGCRNPYEASKLEGERLVTGFRDRLAIDIVRPSIVTGNSINGFTPTFNGMYPFLRFCCTFKRELERLPMAGWLPGDLVSRGAVNLVPADTVATLIRSAVEHNGQGWRELNLVNPYAWSFRSLGECISEFLDIRPVDFASKDGRLSRRAEQALAQLLATYGDYFEVQPQLDGQGAEILLRATRRQLPAGDCRWIQALLQWGSEHRWRRLV